MKQRVRLLACLLTVIFPACAALLPTTVTVPTANQMSVDPFGTSKPAIIDLGAPHGGTLRASAAALVRKWHTQAASATAGQIANYVYTLKTATAAVGDGGPAAAGVLNGATDVVVDASGNVIVCDTANNRIRLICQGSGLYFGTPMTTGNIYTLAGGGPAAGPDFGDTGPGTASQLNKPQGVALDAAGNLYIADTGNNRVRVLSAATATLFGVPTTMGHIHTLAGDAAGNTAAVSGNTNGNGGPATSAKLSAPIGLAFDTAGNLYVADSGTNQVRMVAVGTTSAFGANGGLALMANGIYPVAGTGGQPRGGTNGDGGPAQSASLQNPTYLAFNANGDLFVSDTGNHRVRAVSRNNTAIFGVAPGADGDIVTVAGDGSGNASGNGGDAAGATACRLSAPRKLAFDTNATQDLIIADTGNHRLRAVAGANANSAYNVTLTTANSIYHLAGQSAGIPGATGDGIQGNVAGLNGAAGFAIDPRPTHALYVADTGNNKVRQVPASGVIAALAGTGAAIGTTVGTPTTVATSTVTFTNVPDGTYVLQVDALNGATQSIVQGGPQVSLTTATVSGSTVTYSNGAAGLAVTLPLSDATAATSTVTPSSPNLSPTRWGASLVNRGTKAILASFLTGTSAAFSWLNLADGTYDAWVFARDGSGLATPAQPTTITVSGSGTSVTNPGVDLAGLLSTSAGGGGVGDGYPAMTAGIANVPGGGGIKTVRDVAVDSAGNLFLADMGTQRIRMVCKTSGTYFGQAMTAGNIYTIAGNGTNVLENDSLGLVATATGVVPNQGLAVDASGNVFFSDSTGNRVRMIARTTTSVFGVNGGQTLTVGHVYCVAGDAASSSVGTNLAAATVSNNGNNAAASDAVCRLSAPSGLAFDAAGNLYICDSGHGQVRMLPKTDIPGGLWGANTSGALTANAIYAVAGGGGTAAAGAAGDGGLALATTVLSAPQGLAFDANGDMLIADTSHHRVRAVAKTGGNTVFGVTLTNANRIYHLVGSATSVSGTVPGAATTTARLNSPTKLICDAAGNLFIAGRGGHVVTVVTPGAGTVLGVTPGANSMGILAGTATLSGNSGEGLAATAARLNTPYGFVVDADGNLIIGDSANARVRMVPAATGTYFGVGIAANTIGTIVGNAATSAFYVGDGGTPTSLSLSQVAGVAYDASDNLYVADSVTHLVRMVCHTGGTYFGIAMTAGHIYRIAGNGTGADGTDGGSALASSLRQPSGLVVDGAGNLYIADTANNRVRMVANGTSTVPCVNGGNALTPGAIYPVASKNGAGAGSSGVGGVATDAVLNSVKGLALDGAGNLYLATSNRAVFVVANTTINVLNANGGAALTVGNLYTVAGTPGVADHTGDGGPALSATLFTPDGVAVDAGGNLYVSDASRQRVRFVAARSGPLWGQTVTAFSIYNLAGSSAGSGGSTGDGGLATAGFFFAPTKIALDGGGNLYVCDSTNRKVRMVARADNALYTVVGTPANASGGADANTGDGAAATGANAHLSSPAGLAISPTGRLSVGSTDRVRTVY